MSDSNVEFVSVDTRVFDKCIAQKDDYIRRYNEIVTDYDAIINRLAENWSGSAADAFFEDARKIRTNIVGIADILSNMVSTMEDIRAVLGEVDSSLGEFNRNPDSE